MVNTDEASHHVETDEHHGTAQLGGSKIEIDFDNGKIAGADAEAITIPKTAKNVEIEKINGKLTIKVDGKVVYPKP